MADRLPGLVEVLDRLEALAAEGEDPFCIVLDEFARWIDDRLRTFGIRGARRVGAAAIHASGSRTEDMLKLARQLWFQNARSSKVAYSPPRSTWSFPTGKM